MNASWERALAPYVPEGQELPVSTEEFVIGDLNGWWGSGGRLASNNCAACGTHRMDYVQWRKYQMGHSYCHVCCTGEIGGKVMRTPTAANERQLDRLAKWKPELFAGKAVRPLQSLEAAKSNPWASPELHVGNRSYLNAAFPGIHHCPSCGQMTSWGASEPAPGPSIRCSDCNIEWLWGGELLTSYEKWRIPVPRQWAAFHPFSRTGEAAQRALFEGRREAPPWGPSVVDSRCWHHRESGSFIAKDGRVEGCFVCAGLERSDAWARLTRPVRTVVKAIAIFVFVLVAVAMYLADGGGPCFLCPP